LHLQEVKNNIYIKKKKGGEKPAIQKNKIILYDFIKDSYHSITLEGDIKLFKFFDDGFMIETQNIFQDDEVLNKNSYLLLYDYEFNKIIKFDINSNSNGISTVNKDSSNQTIIVFFFFFFLIKRYFFINNKNLKVKKKLKKKKRYYFFLIIKI
jgi:hypothetical protein